MIQALTNHLWQSTLCAAIAGLLMLALRRNQAGIRYRIWMAVSIKFFVPFAILVAAGSHLNWSSASVRAFDQPGLAIAMEAAAQPFAVPSVPAPVAKGTAAGLVPILGIVWVCGIIVVLGHWLYRWSKMRSIVRGSAPLELPFPVPVRTSTSLIEPGVCGILRPVLLMPDGMIDYLTPEQLQAILAHERSHVRRRDNLTGVIHMLVQATFWFHPLVWWIGSRLVEERERACDEEVLRRGIEPEVYAEGILNICKLYVQAPLACVSGVTGADLRKRIETILANPGQLRLNLARQALLAVCLAVVCVVPVAIGIWNPAPIRAQAPAQSAAKVQKFDVASVKVNTSNDQPNSNFPLGPGDVYVRNGGYLSATGYPLQAYIGFAFKTIGNQGQYVAEQLPDWAKTNRYDIQARAQGNPGKDDMRAMMQSLLAERFKLKTHYQDREVPVFAMVLAKNGETGPALQRHAASSDCPTEPSSASTPGVVNGAPAFCNGIYPLPSKAAGHLRFGGRNVTLAFIGDTFGAGAMGRAMVDQTVMTGRFDFTLEWAQELPQQGRAGVDAPAADITGPSFQDAMRDQLGIKLQARKAPVSVLVVDHLEKPSEN